MKTEKQFIVDSQKESCTLTELIIANDFTETEIESLQNLEIEGTVFFGMGVEVKRIS